MADTSGMCAHGLQLHQVVAEAVLGRGTEGGSGGEEEEERVKTLLLNSTALTYYSYPASREGLSTKVERRECIAFSKCSGLFTVCQKESWKRRGKG